MKTTNNFNQNEEITMQHFGTLYSQEMKRTMKLTHIKF
jgi:hypothetical protein